jgi:hypothetical protein
VAPPASHTRKRRHVVLAVALVTSDAACGNRTHDLRTTRARLTWARSCCRRLLSHPTPEPSRIMPIMSGTIEDSEVVDVNTQRVSCHVRVTPPEEDRLLLRCAAQRAACGNRTHDLRITRAPRKCSWRSTSTDSTPHSSQATEGPGRTRFVSHGLSHDVMAVATHAIGVDVDRTTSTAPPRGELAGHHGARHAGWSVSSAVGRADVRRVCSVNAKPSRQIMYLTLSRITYLRGNLHRTGLAGCRGPEDVLVQVERGEHEHAPTRRPATAGSARSPGARPRPASGCPSGRRRLTSS